MFGWPDCGQTLYLRRVSQNTASIMLGGIWIISLRNFGWAVIPYFWSIGIFAVIRAAGSSILWIQSTLLLQNLSAPHMLDLVLAADYAIA